MLASFNAYVLTDGPVYVYVDITYDLLPTAYENQQINKSKRCSDKGKWEDGQQEKQITCIEGNQK